MFNIKNYALSNVIGKILVRKARSNIILFLLLAAVPLALISCGNAETSNDKSLESADAPSNRHMSDQSSKLKGEQLMQPAEQSKSRFDIPDCANVLSKTADESSELFEKQYPAALVNPDTVDSESLSPDELAAIVTFSACSAANTNFEPFVAENALALFSSPKYGVSAFDVLKKMNMKQGFEGKAANEFADQMNEYLKEPTE